MSDGGSFGAPQTQGSAVKFSKVSILATIGNYQYMYFWPIAFGESKFLSYVARALPASQGSFAQRTLSTVLRSRGESLASVHEEGEGAMATKHGALVSYYIVHVSILSYQSYCCANAM